MCITNPCAEFLNGIHKCLALSKTLFHQRLTTTDKKETKHENIMDGRMRNFVKNCRDNRFFTISNALCCIAYTFAAWKYQQKVPALKNHTWLGTLKNQSEVRCQGKDEIPGIAGKKVKEVQKDESQGINPPVNEKRIIIVGASDFNKYNSASFLMQKRDPKTSCYRQRSQLNTLSKEIDFIQYKIDIIDTPPVIDYNRITDDKKDLEIYKTIALSSPGPHAFVLCVPVKNINTPSVYDAIKPFENLFGDKIYDFVILAFTHYDQFEQGSVNEKSKKTHFDEELTDAIKTNKVLGKIKNVTKKYIVFNSWVTEPEKEENLKQVVDIILQRKSQTEYEKVDCITCDLSEHTEAVLKEKIVAVKKVDKKDARDRTCVRDQVKQSKDYTQHIENSICE